MKHSTQPLRLTVISALFGATIGLPLAMTGCAMATCKPCAPRTGNRNPCSPCAAKNPCAAMNPCAAKNPCAAMNPCAAKNPCAGNPCAAGDRVDPKMVTRPAGTRPYQGNQAALLAEGKALWNSKEISRNNSVACSTCHEDGTAMLQPGFAKPFPHFVQMVAEDNGMQSITLEGMVQYCMIKPMQSKPFSWDSRQLAALTAYTELLRKKFKPMANAANPCAARNPCAPKNPCSMKNPCGMRNPCSMRNPCAAR